MKISTRYLLILILFCIMDVIIPLPILGLLLISVVFQKPTWFLEMVRKLYNE